MIYLWLKVLHVVAVISWMAGLLYLPRLMVYHADAEPGGEADSTFRIMERRLYRAIMMPAMIVSWMAGLGLAFGFGVVDFAGDIWFYGKLALVTGMTGYHHFLGRHVRAFADGENRHSARFYRFINEVPTLLMIVIVVLVVIKPF